MKPEGLVRFEVREGETDLAVFAARDLSAETRGVVRGLRADLEGYAREHGGFLEALKPLEPAEGAPEIVRRMCRAAVEWGVAADSDEVIVENGGDVYLSTAKPRKVAIFAGDDSPFGGDLAVLVKPETGIHGVCASSATVGHSLSFGRADAVVAFAPSAAFADAAATAICNRVGSKGEVEKIIEDERRRARLTALVVIMDDVMGAFGDVEFV
jgi:ApbE superfamily uncharacterized protein (UPF0280 family)